MHMHVHQPRSHHLPLRIDHNDFFCLLPFLCQLLFQLYPLSDLPYLPIPYQNIRHAFKSLCRIHHTPIFYQQNHLNRPFSETAAFYHTVYPTPRPHVNNSLVSIRKSMFVSVMKCHSRGKPKGSGKELSGGGFLPKLPIRFH